MGFFDRVNVLKKKKDRSNDFSVSPENDPLSGRPSFQANPAELPAQPPGSIHATSGQTPFQSATLDSTADLNNPGKPSNPMEDHRMRMPLGESIRQQRIAAMHEAQPLEEPSTLKKDLELISSKLDYLKASLDAVNQRIINLESLTRQEMEQHHSEKIARTKLTNPPT